MKHFLRTGERYFHVSGGILLLCSLAVIFNLSSCTKSKSCCTFPANLNFRVFVQNKQSDNLLDPNATGTYDPNDVKVYYLHDGKKEIAYAANLDHPQFWDIEKDSTTGEYFLLLRVSDYENKQAKSTTFISWNHQDTDTIVCAFGGKNPNPVQKIWWDDKLVWDANTSKHEFTITK